MHAVSVIIPVWNGLPYLGACLDSLLRSSLPGSLEIIAVDNASGDGSAQWIAKRYPQVRLLRNAQNEGFAGGCNRGLQAATGALLILLNQDTIAEPGWCAALVAALDDPTVGVAGCKILYPDRSTLQHAGGWIEWPLGLSHHHGQGKPDRGQWSQDRDVDFVTGAGLAIRREVIDQMGLLDAGFWPGYFEDADLCLRVTDAGYRVRYVAGAVLTHAESTSITDPLVLAEAYHCGRLRFVLKHLPPERWLAEFAPAERAYQPGFIASPQHAALHVAYQSAQLAAPALLAARWGADAPIVDRVTASLRALAARAWSLDEAALAEGEHPVATPAVGGLPALWYTLVSHAPVARAAQRQAAASRRRAGQFYALCRQVEMLNRALASGHQGVFDPSAAPIPRRSSDRPDPAMTHSQQSVDDAPTAPPPIPDGSIHWDGLIEIHDPDIDPEAIMATIRQRIQQRRAELGDDDPVFPIFGGAPYPPLPQGATYDADLRHYLRLANDSFVDIETEPVLAPSPATAIPLLGRLWQLVRGGAHQLVLFYVNRAVAQQTGVNRHLVSALNRMTVLVEQQQRTIDQLQAEVDALRQRTE